MRRVKNVRGAFTLSCTVLGFALFPVGFEQACRIVELLFLHFPIQPSVLVERENQEIQVPNILGCTVDRFEEDDSAPQSSVCELRKCFV